MHSIDGETGVLGIIGNPIGHSFSPKLHNYLLDRLNLNYRYISFCVERNDLKQMLDGMRSMNIRGVNVTAPFKRDVIPLLDGISPRAEVIGSVNTIVNEKGKLIGYNTDHRGFSQSLKINKINPSGWKAVILGAGGAATGVAYALVQDNIAAIVIYNRKLKRAQSLAQNLNAQGSTVDCKKFSNGNLSKDIREARLLINTTPVGTYPDTDATVIDPDLLHSDLVVYDLIYNPSKTRLLQAAEAREARIINGLDMLILQGIESLKLWTGVEIDHQLILELQKFLEEGEDG